MKAPDQHFSRPAATSRRLHLALIRGFVLATFVNQA